MKELMVTQQIVSQALEPVFKNWIALIETNNRRDIELARINADLRKAIHLITTKGKTQRSAIIAFQNIIISAINNSALPNEIKKQAISEGYNIIREIAGI